MDQGLTKEHLVTLLPTYTKMLQAYWQIRLHLPDIFALGSNDVSVFTPQGISRSSTATKPVNQIRLTSISKA